MSIRCFMIGHSWRYTEYCTKECRICSKVERCSGWEYREQFGFGGRPFGFGDSQQGQFGGHEQRNNPFLPDFNQQLNQQRKQFNQQLNQQAKPPQPPKQEYDIEGQAEVIDVQDVKLIEHKGE